MEHQLEFGLSVGAHSFFRTDAFRSLCDNPYLKVNIEPVRQLLVLYGDLERQIILSQLDEVSEQICSMPTKQIIRAEFDRFSRGVHVTTVLNAS